MSVPVDLIFASRPNSTTKEAAIWAVGSTGNNATYDALSWGIMKWETATAANGTNNVTIHVDSYTSDRPLPTSATFYERLASFYREYARHKPRRRSGSDMVGLFLMSAISMDPARGRPAVRADPGSFKRVTDFENHSLAIYVFLAVFAIVLGTTKEILQYVVMPAGGHNASEVFSCDPNSLSCALGAALERCRGRDISGKMVVVRKYLDEHGKERVGPYIRRRLTRERETSGENENTADKIV